MVVAACRRAIRGEAVLENDVKPAGVSYASLPPSKQPWQLVLYDGLS